MTEKPLRTVDRAFAAISFLNRGMGRNDLTAAFRVACKEERDYRRSERNFAAGRYPVPSVPAIARMMLIQRIAEHLEGRAMPTPGDFLSVPHSALYAAAFVAERGGRIREVWESAGLNIAELAKLDYCKFVRVRGF